jgi:hypothetical protein
VLPGGCCSCRYIAWSTFSDGMGGVLVFSFQLGRKSRSGPPASQQAGGGARRVNRGPVLPQKTKPGEQLREQRTGRPGGEISPHPAPGPGPSGQIPKAVGSKKPLPAPHGPSGQLGWAGGGLAGGPTWSQGHLVRWRASPTGGASASSFASSPSKWLAPGR